MDVGFKARSGDLAVLECEHATTASDYSRSVSHSFKLMLVDSATREGKIKRVCMMGNGGQPSLPYPAVRVEAYNARSTFVVPARKLRDPIRAVADAPHNFDTLEAVKAHLRKYA